ncbi:Aste57867_16519 [Aphanomyces stellatus]|uniref:Aste57867_16519 protein n=1 Tax=Aphanomyces stellatus TaxID=120398 RepID=A0A485L5M5_9STRA|nr:hypothetical protein As57867_016462 [Aphanomyces stellatus]VFT93293.1 Aste57867_16519 [Aphanomyces stellatus]
MAKSFKRDWGSPSSKMARYEAERAIERDVARATAASAPQLRQRSVAQIMQMSRLRLEQRRLPTATTTATAQTSREATTAIPSTRAIQKFLDRTHSLRLPSTTPATLRERCLHVLAQHLDAYDASGGVIQEAMQWLESTSILRLSRLSVFYGTMTDENAAYVCTPSPEALCLGRVNVEAVLPSMTPQAKPISVNDDDENGDATECWEDLVEDSTAGMHWSGCPNLRHLELVQCHQISPAFLAEFQHLTSLSLVGCSDLDAVDANLLLHLPPRLESLSIIACNWLTLDMLQALVSQLDRLGSPQQLTCLRVWGCGSIPVSAQQTWTELAPHIQIDIRDHLPSHK